MSIFGESTLARAVSGTREGRRIGRVPLDGRLGLPAGESSHVPEDRGQRLGLKGPSAEAGHSLPRPLGLKLRARTLERVSREVSGDAPDSQDAPPSPPPEGEGPPMVVTADGKGVPMRRPPQDDPEPHHRRAEGEEADKKRMACVGAVYSIQPFVRRADDIPDEVLGDERAGGRPGPRHEHARAGMTREVGGEAVDAQEALFARVGVESTARDSGHARPVIGPMDGGRALWGMQRGHFPGAAGILDLFRVRERLRAVAHRSHKEGSDPARRSVEERLRDLLRGRVGHAIAGLRRRPGRGELGAPRREVVKSAAEYLADDRGPMRYDGYPAAGDPIGGGVAEGACRHPVEDRPGQAGMRWTVEGARAMLHVRALYPNGQWDEFLGYRIEREQARLDSRVAA